MQYKGYQNKRKQEREKIEIDDGRHIKINGAKANIEYRNIDKNEYDNYNLKNN